jgi:hypothetical protein
MSHQIGGWESITSLNLARNKKQEALSDGATNFLQVDPRGICTKSDSATVSTRLLWTKPIAQCTFAQSQQLSIR